MNELKNEEEEKSREKGVEKEKPIKKGKNGKNRNEKGQFVEGHGIKGGRPRGSVSIVTELKRDLRDGKMEEVKGIFWELVEKRKWSALQELIRQIDGRPKQKMDITSKGERITGFDYVRPDASQNKTDKKTR